MNLNNKILPVALVAALLGGSVGAYVMRPSRNVEVASASTTVPTAKSLTATTPASTDTSANDQTTPLNEQGAASNLNEADANNVNLDDEQEAYRDGFNEGVRAARTSGLSAGATQRSVVTRTAPAATRVVYRNNATRQRYARSSGARQVYYDYEQPRKRSFWSRHRNKLTVAAGAGGGAIVGGLIGGKKGAAIGALAGGGGSALYTYKLRKRDRRY